MSEKPVSNGTGRVAYRIAEVAAMTGAPASTIHDWIRRGQLSTSGFLLVQARVEPSSSSPRPPFSGFSFGST